FAALTPVMTLLAPQAPPKVAHDAFDITWTPGAAATASVAIRRVDALALAPVLECPVDDASGHVGIPAVAFAGEPVPFDVYVDLVRGQTVDAGDGIAVSFTAHAFGQLTLE